MSLISTVQVLIAAEAGHAPETHSWILPENAELIYASTATVLVVGLLVKFAGPAAKKALKARTARIQSELDESASARQTAQTEAAQIRQAAGDIESERARLLAEADQTATTLLADGRARLATEIAELESRADADLAAAAGRGSDELHAEIARLSGAAAERLVTDVLDEAAHNQLIEAFIAKVGAS